MAAANVACEVTIVERGWAGHFVLGQQCIFRRNTLLTHNGFYIVVSTLGKLIIEHIPQEIGINRWYETRAFIGKQDGLYIDADAGFQVSLCNQQWAIGADSYEDLPDDVDNLANDMHENNVEFVKENFQTLYQSASKQQV